MIGVYIKGMTMPTRCGHCNMCFKAPIATYTCCITGANIDNLGEMMEDCPLVPVPPHGRLIDADELITDRLEFEARQYTVRDEFDKGRLAGWNDVIRAIRWYVPTIISTEKNKNETELTE